MVTLKMIDSIQGLGISHHLKDEINVQLRRICDHEASMDLFGTSLQFRLLRHNGWPTCSGTLYIFPFLINNLSIAKINKQTS